METPLPTNPELRKLFFAQLPADFADWLDFVAIGALLAFVWEAEPFVFALLAVCMGLPYLMVGPFAGVFVDRCSIRNIMLWSNFGRALVTTAFFFAPNWPTLLLLVAARSAVDSFFTPAKQAAIQNLTVSKNRLRANSISHGINQLSKIVAPAFGGGLLIWLAPQYIFLLNAVVSLVAVFLFYRLKPFKKSEPMPDSDSGGILATLRNGFGEVMTKPLLRSALGMMAAGYFAMFFYDTLIAPLTREFGFTQTHLGFSIAAVGAGGVLGAVVLSLIKDIRQPFLLIAIGSFVSGSIVICGGAAEMLMWDIEITTYIAAFFIVGLSTSLSLIPFRTVIQDTVSESSIGRITALSEATNTAALLTAPFLGAFIASIVSIGAAFICGGAVMIIVAVRALALKRQR